MPVGTMIKPLVKKGVKRVLRSVNLYPFLPNAAKVETARWRSTLPDWAPLVGRDRALWASARAAAENGPKVLIATPTYSLDSVLAVALTLRGARVHNLLCDTALPACMFARVRYFGETTKYVKNGPSKLMCRECYGGNREVFRALGLPTHRYRELVSDRQRQQARELAADLPLEALPDYRLDGVAIGEQALAGALRFYARGTLDGEPHGEVVLRQYFEAAVLTAQAARRLMETCDFACATMLHGIYVPHGVILKVAQQRKLRTASWSPTYRNQTFIFSHEDSYHHTMLTEPTADWEDRPWTPEMESEIVEYLESREYGTRDWISYHRDAQRDLASITAELGLDSTKPCIGMLTNVMLDAQVMYPGNAFSNMVDWAVQTIRYFAGRPALQLLIRVHPAEVRGGTDPSRQPLMNEIRRVFPALPPNVVVIPPDSPISTYAAMSQCDAVIIYGTKMGIELTSMSIPVIVAGEAWVRNKGLTLDAGSPEEYFRLLDQLPLGERLGEDATRRARKYAYHYFLRRMIPLPFMQPGPGGYEVALSGLGDLLPGRSVGLDVICDGILHGTKFIYPAERRLEKLAPSDSTHMRRLPEQ